MHLVTDGVHEVGLAQPHASVQEERVVAVAWRLRDRLGGGVRELRVVADNE